MSNFKPPSRKTALLWSIALSLLILSVAVCFLPNLTLLWPFFSKTEGLSGVELLLEAFQAAVYDPAFFLISISLFIAPFLLHLLVLLLFATGRTKNCALLLLFISMYRLTLSLVFLLRSSVRFNVGWWLGLASMGVCGLLCLFLPPVQP